MAADLPTLINIYFYTVTTKSQPKIQMGRNKDKKLHILVLREMKKAFPSQPCENLSRT
jgi:hypothetical protein